ncbi:ABC transporter substrate binding protein [Butyrivibrio sp. YAB3001]|uniref:ABC transporter substrate binding protein n=1 Tax=Butyrivibrio sp. YAB3001 TaxID=1520812 RepID=UPI0008F65431|nr:ABC transporter substrate binding protein [Butyrivibrio sp. YAB3001]SFC90224.1 diguanylate cyclase (GGDEF) domain-containing protein [Butyrivibrio sp. YAB3001]
MKRLRIIIIIVYSILALIVSPAVKLNAEDNLERQFHILFISSYGYSNAGVPDQLEGFRSGIDGINVDITFEFMDAEKYYSSVDIMNFDKYVRYKIFTDRDYDLVAVADDPALRYAINNRSKLFPDIPLVFMGINNMTEATTAAAMKNATGIAEKLDFFGNYLIMQSLFPKRDHMVVVVDSSVAGQGDYVEFMKFRDEHPEINSSVINTSYYTVNGLKEAFGSLGEKDIILFLDFSMDGDNNAYSLQNASTFLSQNAKNVPIFRLASSDVEHGVLGGISYSYYDAGRLAGDAAKRILSGEAADEIELMTSAGTTPYFEQSCMDQFGIRYSQLPNGSVILNERETFSKFYRENKTISNLTIVIAFLMIFIIGLLYMSNQRRKNMIRTDFMTQMPNRKKIMEDINQAVDAKAPYGIIMLDVDHFKSINDTYGHKVGDEVIIAVAGRLQELADKGLVFARLGGDEFCGLFSNPSEVDAMKICGSIQRAMRNPISTSGGIIDFTVSIGCAMYPVDTKLPGKVMENADKALYETKEKGRNGFTLFGRINEPG